MQQEMCTISNGCYLLGGLLPDTDVGGQGSCRISVALMQPQSALTPAWPGLKYCALRKTTCITQATSWQPVLGALHGGQKQQRTPEIAAFH